VLLLANSLQAQFDPLSLKRGDTLQIDGRLTTIQRLETMPYVQSEYTKRFKFDTFENPKLKDLRDHHHLDQVIAPGKDEFEQQVLLMDWAHQQFKKFGHPSTNVHGAIQILDSIDKGHSFFCAQYAQVLVSAAASLGWVDRELALRCHQGNVKNGSSEHSTTEIWSNQHRKWIMLDPTSNMYLEKNGVPLNAWEIRDEWFYHGGSNLLFVVGKERKRYKKSDLPVFLARFEGFGNLTIDPDEPNKYGFIGYIPNTDLMDAGEDYGQMFITKDKVCAGQKWHERKNPAQPATDPYFPIDQSALTLHPGKGALKASLQTFTPNFKEFQIRVDAGDGADSWKNSSSSFDWKVHHGVNKLEARAINKFGVAGPVSSAEVLVR
jgi:hypothetical protein